MTKEQITIVILIITNVIIVYFSYYKSYRSEKGKNEAIKEDIKEITNKVEGIKSEINLLSTSRLNLINEERNTLVDAFIGLCNYINKLNEFNSLPKSFDNYDYNNFIEFLKDEYYKWYSLYSRIHLFNQSREVGIQFNNAQQLLYNIDTDLRILVFDYAQIISKYNKNEYNIHQAETKLQDTQKAYFENHKHKKNDMLKIQHNLIDSIRNRFEQIITSYQ